MNGHMFDAPATGVAVMAYDYTVFAGTQGVHNHWKTDKILDITVTAGNLTKGARVGAANGFVSAALVMMN